ncbi:glycerophosphodiester phosphodiesterase family protein [Erythrobacter sp.]|uniref:glycerophosphodiester phosphodiesterase family protein n=1 Tax=Erythrobacter sp. TaxID=1042 RepID=UPI002EAFABA6|nr:glycerophosphodiester phosphodiesterase family protein [Erythrobacter sp.]
MSAFSRPLAAAIALTLAVPASAQAGDGAWRFSPGGDLSALLDCHEAAGRTLVSAHRGGPTPGLPENAIQTMDAVLTAIPAVMEVDVARSPDGVHYLMHDRTLDRTTTGNGAVADTPWSVVRELFLVDEAGWTTPYRVPTLREALDWARGRTVLQIDFKSTADYAEVVSMIRESGNADNVILIAYSPAQAARLAALAPEMLLSVSIADNGDLEELRASGIADERMVAFTGTRLPRPDLYDALEAEDIEVIFGTLGRPPGSIDSVIERYGTGERYAELGEGGVDIIATDRPREAAAALAEAGRLPEAGLCGVSRGGGGE